jgi:hypothetical protein
MTAVFPAVTEVIAVVSQVQFGLELGQATV